MEHTLGVWVHAQRQKRRRGELAPGKVKLLDGAVPGWQTGKTRGRPPQVNKIRTAPAESSLKTSARR